MKTYLLVIAGFFVSVVAAAGIAAQREGVVEFDGAQKNFFKTGKADAVMSLTTLSGRKSLFAVGAVEGLDGEITIFDSKPCITKVRGSDFTVDNSLNHNAAFLVWTYQSSWQEIAIPASVKSYVDLQQFIKAEASGAGIDAGKPFIFLISGTVDEIKWHINVDRTEGKPITKELFARSKELYTIRNEAVDIIGFYSELHHGQFISEYAPGIKPEIKPEINPASGIKNAIHIHLISKDSKASGHVDDISAGKDMVLRLPKHES